MAKCWTVTDIGTLELVDSSTSSVNTVVSISASESWLTYSSYGLVAPGFPGSIVTLTPAGSIIQTRWIMERVAFAVGYNTRVYCFDGRGKGRVLTIDINNKIITGEVFSAPNTVNLIDARIFGSILYVLADDRIIQFSLTDPDAPVFTTQTRNTHDLTGLVDTTRQTSLQDQGQFFSGDRWQQLLAGWYASPHTYLVGRSALIDQT